MPANIQPPTLRSPDEELMRTLKFAGKLAVYRRLKNLTIAELSAKTQVHPDTMERLLSGKHAPNAKNLKLIENALDIQFEPEDFEESGL